MVDFAGTQAVAARPSHRHASMRFVTLLRAKGGAAAVDKATQGLIDPVDLKSHINGTVDDLALMLDRRTAIANAIIALL